VVLILEGEVFLPDKFSERFIEPTGGIQIIGSNVYLHFNIFQEFHILKQFSHSMGVGKGKEKTV
jgi:hypothetical protein